MAIDFIVNYASTEWGEDAEADADANGEVLTLAGEEAVLWSGCHES